MPHKVDDKAVFTLNLQGYFSTEAGGFPWFAYGETSEAHPLVKYSENAQVPRPEQRMFATDLAQFLNKFLALDGAWWVLLKEMDVERDDRFVPHVTYTVFEMIFIDKDGDTQFAVESEDQHWTQWLVKGRQHWGEIAYEAWRQSGEFKNDTDAKSMPQIKAALGEQSKGPRIPLA